MCVSTDHRVVSFSFAPKVLPSRDMMGVLQIPRETLGRAIAKAIQAGAGGAGGGQPPQPIGQRCAEVLWEWHFSPYVGGSVEKVKPLCAAVLVGM